MTCDAQLIVVIKESGFGRILSRLLAFLLLFSTQSKCFLKVPLLRGKVTVLSCGGPLTLLDRFTKLIVGIVTPCVLARLRSSPFVLVTKVSFVDGRSGVHAIPHVSSRPSLFSQPCIVGEKVGNVFGLLTYICALVFAVLVNILELLEGLDDVDIITEIDDDVLRASVQAVIEKSKRLRRTLQLAIDWNRTGNGVRTLKTCLQFFPLSLSRLSRISMISTKSFLDRVGKDKREPKQSETSARTNWLYVIWAISFIWVPEGPQGSLEVASRTFAWTSE